LVLAIRLVDRHQERTSKGLTRAGFQLSESCSCSVAATWEPRIIQVNAR
jgi:hypothetical protein